MTWLTNRERVVLTHIALPLTITEIAAGLWVSPNTVKTQLRSIYAKLGVSSRDAAVAAGLALGLLEAAPGPEDELPAPRSPHEAVLRHQVESG